MKLLFHDRSRWFYVLAIALLLTDPHAGQATEVDCQISQSSCVDIVTPQAKSLFEKGKQQLLNNHLTEAQKSFQQALTLYRQQEDQTGEAITLNRLGETLINVSQYPQATEALQQALGLWRQLGDRAGEAEALTLLGSLYRSQKQYPQAENLYQQAIALQAQLNDPIAKAETLIEMAALAMNQNQAEESLKLLQQALKNLEPSGSSSAQQQQMQRGRVLAWMGITQLNLQQSEAALQSLQQALALNRETGDRRFEGLSLFFLSNWQMSQKQPEQALTSLQQALALYENSGDRSSIGHLQNLTGNVHYRLGQYPQAIAAYQQALAMQQALNDRKEIAQVWANLGGAYQAEKQIPQAIEAYQQALTRYEEIKEPKQQAQIWSNLGELYGDQKQYKQAVEAYQKALGLYQTQQNPQAELRILTAIALNSQQVLFQLKADPAKAGEAEAVAQANLKYLQQAEQLAQKLQEPQTEGWVALSIAQTYGYQGEILSHQGKPQEELALHQQAIEKFQQVRSLAQTFKMTELEKLTLMGFWSAYTDRGFVFERLIQPAEAIIEFEKALTVIRKNRKILSTIEPLKVEIQTLLQIGGNYDSLGQSQKALNIYQEALALSQQVGDPARGVDILQVIASTYNKLSQYPQALETAQKALIIVQQTLKDPEQEAEILTVLALIQSNQGNFAEAIAANQRALSIAKQKGDILREMLPLNNLSNIYEQQGQYQQALQMQEQVTAIISQAIQSLEAGDDVGLQRFCPQVRVTDLKTSPFLRASCIDLVQTSRSAALNNLAQSYSSIGRYSDALKRHQQSLEIVRSLKDRGREATSLNNIGTVYLHTGGYPQALSYFQEALEIAVAIGDRSQQNVTLNNIGAAYQEQGRYAQALEARQKALKIAQDIGDRSAEGTILNGIGTLYQAQSKYSQSLKAYQQALKIEEELGGTGTIPLNNIAHVYSTQGENTKALEFYEKALKAAQATGDRPNEAMIIANMSDIDWSQGRYALSLQKQQQALTTHQETGARASEAVMRSRLGWAYRILGQYDRALDFLQQALSLNKSMGIRGQEASNLNQIGVTYREQKRYPEAQEKHRQALKIQEEIGDLQGASSSLVNLGLTQVRQGEFEPAIASFQQALKIQKMIDLPPGQSIALRGLGLAYAGQGKLPQAIETLQQALAIHRTIGERDEEGITLSELGYVFLKNQQPQAAETVLLQASEILDSLRTGLSDRDTVSLFDTQTKTYRLLQQALIAQNKPEAALEAAERGRARAFVALLAQRLQPNSDTSGDVRAATATSALTLTQIQQLAKTEQATLVEYSIIDEQTLYVWVVKPTGQIAFRQVDLTPWQQENLSLSKMIAVARCLGVRRCEKNTIATRGGLSGELLFNNAPAERRIAQTTTESAAKYLYFQKLHQILIQPIADLLPTDPDDHVIFVPQGELFSVPFAALQDEQGKFLIEAHTLRTAPSIQVLQLTQTQAKQLQSSQAISGTPLIVGNPTMPTLVLEPGQPAIQLPALPGAEREAEAIAQFFNTTFLTGDQATKATVLNQISQAGLIHLATHGLLDDFTGGSVPGAIALAPAHQASATRDAQDSLLTAEEILNLKLQAKLVVLSACDSGRGHVTGDGVIGLSRSLISAGVPSVIVSLWAVPDNPTAELMITFYETLKQNPDKAQALRQAMLTTLKKHPEPMAWAAFTLIGAAQ